MRRRRRKLPTTPLALEIEKLSHEGRGIAHHEGKVVFVEGALPGETVDAVLTDRRDSYDEARVTEVHKASPDRITPPCEYAGICGGCSLLHFDPKAQLAFKESMLFEKLEHTIPGCNVSPLEALTGPVLGYRRKARLAVRFVAKKNQVLVGFREKHSPFITHMDNCQVMDPRLAGLLPGLSALIGNLQGFRHIPQIEAAAGDPDLPGITCALVFRNLQPLNGNDIEKLTGFAEETQTAVHLQPGGVDSVYRIWPEEGEDLLRYRLPDFNLTLGFHPMDFTQVNGEINRKMIARAMELLDLGKDDSVLDLFCGLGNFTLPIARHCNSVVGIEGAQSLVDRAKENAGNNGIDNAEFHCADLARPMSGTGWLDRRYSKVLLDPPRSGAIEILPDIINIRPARIVYISCNPATLARDAGYLAGQGYTLSDAGVMDMFPQTAHVEAMALFKRQDD